MNIHSTTNSVIKPSTFYAFLAFLLLLGLGLLGVYSKDAAVQSEQQKLLDEIAQSMAFSIERRLSRSFSSTFILAQEVKRSQGKFIEFDKFAAEVIQTLGGISNLQLAPDGIIRQIYPLAGNEKAIGHNLLKDDARAKEALLAIKEKGLTLAGPFELIQGGTALIGRNPVFLQGSNEETFWGFVSALVYLDDLLASTKLDQLANKGYQFQLSRIHPDSKEQEVFFQSDQGLGKKPIFKAVTVPNSHWQVGVSRDNPDQYFIIIGSLASLGFSIIIAFLVNRMLLEPERLRKQVKQQTEKLERMAFRDELTGLVNRRFLAEKLTQEVAKINRYGKRLAILYIDLDDFKRINDTFGHNQGDVLLQTVAERITQTVRESDIVSRLGGDEFAVVLLDLGADEAGLVADKILHAVNKPIMLGKHEVVVGSTIGITLSPDDSTNIDDLLRNADLAMYASKSSGKNCFSFFNAEMQRKVADHLLMEEGLRHALKENEFYLVYQPILSLEDFQPQKFEALIRWNHPQKGLQNPTDFIPVAEQTGLIQDIGYWVIGAACEFISEQRKRGFKPVPIAINVSPGQLTDSNFGHRVEEIITTVGIDARMIELEITESMLMDDTDLALELIVHAKSLGMKISIDDFGTGYSSLAQLKNFPIDTLKIDRSFIKDMEHDANDRRIVEAITVMVHKLGFEVVAEGIETEFQLNFLKKISCASGQGYLFSKPLDASQVEGFCYADSSFQPAI